MRSTVHGINATVTPVLLLVAAWSGSAAAHDISEFSLIEAELASGTTCETITRRYLDALQLRDGTAGLNAISMTSPDALEQSAAIDQRLRSNAEHRPLECVPIVIKDNMDVAGLPTTAGSAALTDNIAPRDAAVVARLRAAGAVIIAKTNMAEWAFSPMRTISSTRGETANPFDIDFVPAGSSGGTAAAVSAGLAPAGLGSDTGNSIRGPASHTGLVGLRPGIGTVPIDGIVPLLAEYDAAGPMTILAEDAATLMDVIASPAGSWTRSYRDALDDHRISGANFAIVSELSHASNPPADPETLAIFQNAIDQLRQAGAHVSEVSIAPILERIDTIKTCVSFREGVRRYLSGRATMISDPLTAFETGNFSPQAREAFAYWISKDERDCRPYEDDASRQELAAELERLMKEVGADALLYPSWTYPPASRSRAVVDYRGDNSQVLAPVSGLPAISVPSGLFRSGLPAGLQFLGPRGSEPLLVAFAHEYQRSSGHIHPAVYRNALTAGAQH